MVAMIAPSTPISRIAGMLIAATSAPSKGEAVASCETISRMTEDIGDIAQPVQKAWRQLVPLPQLASHTPRIIAALRANTSPATNPVSAGSHGGVAATTEVSTNISVVSSEEAVPSWRGQAQ